MNRKQQIIELNAQGKTRAEICKILDCSRSIVCYHLTDGQKSKSIERNNKRRSKSDALTKKIESFKHRPIKLQEEKIINTKRAIYDKVKTYTRDRETGEYMSTFTVEDVLNKFGDKPVCYLTGIPIDLSKPNTYSLDHIIPVSRGGENSLDNMGLCTKHVNAAKSNMTVEEFKLLCQTVTNHLN